MKSRLDDISIRNFLLPGDIGYISYLHGKLYSQEYDYGIAFEKYVAKGLVDFHEAYNPKMDGVWVCEDKSSIVGFLLLQHREAKDRKSVV